MQTQAAETQQQAVPRPQPYLGDAQSLWVLNRWNMHLSFSIEGRNTDTVIFLPRTWIPLDVTQYAQRQQIETSPAFRTMLGQGKVEIISISRAHEILAQEGALEEQQRILSGIRAPTIADRSEMASHAQQDVATPEDIAMANLAGASETEAINRVKLLEMQGAMTPGLQRKVTNYAEERGYEQLTSIVTQIIPTPLNAQ